MGSNTFKLVMICQLYKGRKAALFCIFEPLMPFCSFGTQRGWGRGVVQCW